MRSLILRTATRLLVPVLLLFSLYLLIEGHSAPGGGFPGGLIAAGAYSLYAITFGVRQARSALPLNPASLIGAGLLSVLASGLIPLAAGRAFLEAIWVKIPAPDSTSIEVGTPFLLEIGVYLIVAGAVLAIIFELEARHTRVFAKEDEPPPS